MKINSIYEKIIETKTGLHIPITFSGKTIESRYNPENDIERLFSNLQINGDFIILLGIGSGLLLNKLVNNLNCKFILAVENTEDDINLIMRCGNLINSSKYKITTIDNLHSDLLNNFLPIIYEKIQVIDQKAWILENNQYKDYIQNIIQDTINISLQDYSVQVHFGKIWMHNILSNLKLLSKYTSPKISQINKTKAIILAAGPSLDYNLEQIRKLSKDHYIIATDTAFSSMIKQKISIDAVISLDGQYISSSHFINNLNDTVFFIDLCGNSSAVRKIMKKNKNIIFYNSGHPFCNVLENDYPETFFHLFSGAGTVTIAAIDLATKIGFEDIKVFGADYGYINNKAYMKGTYLDNLYNIKSNHIISNEEQFSKLFYRTKLIKIDNKKTTTEVLNSYKNSMIEYFLKNDIEYNYSNDIYYLKLSRKLQINLNNQYFDFDKWFDKYKKLIENHEIKSFSDLRFIDYSLLPLMSYLKNHDNNIKNDLIKLFHKAFEIISR